MTVNQWEPADCDSGSGSTPGRDVEGLLLCDVLNGEVVGSAIGVYTYDGETGLPIGPPTFVDVVTGLPYVPQGVLGPCPGGDSCAYVTTELLCDNVADGVYTPYVLNQVWNCDGTLLSSATRDLSGAGYIPLGVPGACPDNTAVFAGFVCDNFGGSPQIDATPATCPGSPLSTATPDTVGAGYTEGPAGTFIQTGNVGTQIVFDADPADAQHGFCGVQFTLNAANGNNGFAAYGFLAVDNNGNQIGSDPVFIAAIEASIGVGSDTSMPVGATASATAGGTLVTFTNVGPSANLMTSTATGNFLTREGDGDGQPSTIRLEFDPPVRSFVLTSNTGADGQVGVLGFQTADATPGTYAIPAQPPSLTTVKQFRNPDGTSFYENLDGTDHPPLGTIGDCGQREQIALCDDTGTQFLRVYSLADGAISGYSDYDFEGNLFAPVGTGNICAETLANFRHTPIQVLCWTDNDTGAVVQFLRRYLIDQDGVTVIAAIDSLLDGFTPFVASNLGTVSLCAGSGGTVETPCTTASSIGQICYTPPPFVPAVTLTDTFAGTTVAGANGGPQTFTNNDFGDTGLGRVVVASMSKGAGLTGTAILLGVAPTVANELYSQHFDFGGDVTDLSITFNSFGTLGNEILRNFSVPFDAIAGSGSAVAGNTGVNPTVNNGTVTLTWNGPLADLDFEWRSQAGGTLSTIASMTFTTVASGSSTATVGTAAVLLDCETGATTYRDLSTGAMIDLADITIVDCAASSTEVVTRDVEETLVCAAGVTLLRTATFDGQTGALLTETYRGANGAAVAAPVAYTQGACSLASTIPVVSADHFQAVPGTPWTPAAIPAGRRLTSLTYTVLSGTATVGDATGGTSVALIPSGYSATWSVANDLETLTPPASITSVGGSILVLMTTAL